MTTRVSPTDRIRAEIDALFATDRYLGEAIEDVARLGARLILQTALEAEVTEFLGQERYERGDRARAGSRNGHAPVTVKTTAGPVTLERPKLRGTDESFASRLLGRHVTRTGALESLVIAGYVRGLSTRDVEASLAVALGAGATTSTYPTNWSMSTSSPASMSPPSSCRCSTTASRSPPSRIR